MIIVLLIIHFQNEQIQYLNIYVNQQLKFYKIYQLHLNNV